LHDAEKAPDACRFMLIWREIVPYHRSRDEENDAGNPITEISSCASVIHGEKWHEHEEGMERHRWSVI